MSSALVKEPKVVRCAIYTRKSTTEGLDSDFNTLDAQREAAEHFIKSQAAQGWKALPTRYDDGGFTGGNLERPALTRLMDDIERGEIDTVVVYKVDRLSRSLLDFARLVERFEKRHVAFVSITQHFDTSTSMGRLVLHILLSFAQFERELISERTRDKIAAAKRRGKWTGGPLVLGYRVDRQRRALEVVPEEAAIVKLVFELYERTLSMALTAQRLNARGLTLRTRVAEDGTTRGRPFDKNAVHRLLRNPLYVGKVRHNDDLFPGEHEPIIDPDVFERVQRTLDLRAAGAGARRPRRSESLLTGLLRCLPCDAAMSTSHAYNHRKQRYRYYRCRASQEGLRCPTGLLNANDVEAAVVAQVKSLAKSGALRDRILATLAEGDEGEVELLGTKDRLEARITELGAEAKRLLGAFSSVDAGGRLLAERLGELERETDKHRAGVADLKRRLRACAALRTEGEHVAKLLDAFDEVWDALVPEERREVLRALIARVGVDPESGTLRVTFHEPTPQSPPQPTTEATP